jgi:hypothetical protein
MSAFLKPDWRLMSGYVILLLMFVCHTADATHFRGVRMSWAPYDRSVGTEVSKFDNFIIFLYILSLLLAYLQF